MSSIPIDPRGPAAAFPCPPWCDQRWCETTGTDTHHISAATRWKTLDGEFEISFRRTDEHAFPGQLGGTELAVFLDSTSTPQPERGVQVYLRPAEAVDLGCRLIAAAATAEQVTE